MSVTVEELLVREELRDAMRRYARAVDRVDLDGIRACYHPDAIDERGPYSGPAEGFFEYLTSSRGLPMFESTRHSITDQSIEVRDSMAFSETTVIAYHRLPKEHYIIGIRYLDRFELRDGEWRVAHRKVAYDWGLRRAIVDADEFPETFPRGERGPGDPVYTHLLATFGPQ
jgi:hypothetical protein